MNRHLRWYYIGAIAGGVGGICLPRFGVAQERVVTGHPPTNNVTIAEALLSRPVTITLHGISIERALDSLSRVANAPLQYLTDAIPTPNTIVNVTAQNEALSAVFDRILAGTGLHVIPTQQGHLRLVSGAQSLADSTRNVGSISGRVTDSASGRALNGATVKVAGTKISAITQDSGRFTLRDVPVGERLLTIKMFGYRAAERSITVENGERATLRVALTSVPNVLSGVVTTATGLQDRRSVGNDITVINADSVMRTAPVRSVTDLLETRVPGLTVQRTSGLPGAPSRLRLRGIGGGLVGGANTSNDPIVIVDGARVYARQSTARDQVSQTVGTAQVPIPNAAAPSAIDQIDPNSIETIEVFKGPSATSQWGSDAGNGVIVITTKRGHAGPTQWSANMGIQLDHMPGTYTEPTNYVFGSADDPYTGYVVSKLCPTDLNGLTASAPCYTTFRDSVVPFQALNSPRLSPFGTGVAQDASMSLSGGSSAMNYALSASATSHIGYERMPPFFQDVYRALDSAAPPPSWMTRPDQYRTRNAKGTFGVNPADGLKLTFTTSLSSSEQTQSSAQSVSTLATEYLDTTSIMAQVAYGVGQGLSDYIVRIRSQNVVTNNDVQGEWMRWAWLPMTATLGMSASNRTDRSGIPYDVAVALHQDPRAWAYYSIGRLSALTRDANVSTTLFPHRWVSTSVGVNVTQQSTNDLGAFQDSLQAGVETPGQLKGTHQTTWASNTAGWFLEPRLKLGDTYLTPGFRLDGGSASTARGAATGGILSLFPKINFSWIAIDREDRPLGGVVSLLRPRIAFGIAGVQPDPSWNERILTDSAKDGGLQLLSLGNTQLHPERSQETEGGFEAELWRNRLSLNATMYYKLRHDAIASLPTAPSVYGSLLYLNIGRVRNTGTEVQVQGSIIETPLVRWDGHATFQANRNTLLSINKSAKTYLVGNTTYHVGYPLDGVWTHPILGYLDVNGNGRIDGTEVTTGDSLVYIGSGQPKYELPFGTGVSLWHGTFSVNAEFNYVQGQTQVNTGATQRIVNSYFGSNAPFSVQAAAIALQGCDDLRLNLHSCSQTSIMQTVSTLRFNSLSLRYSVPRTVASKFRLPSTSVAIQGSNLRLWTNYRGKDPNVNSHPVGEGFSDAGQFPLPRTWMLRVNLN